MEMAEEMPAWAITLKASSFQYLLKAHFSSLPSPDARPAPRSLSSAHSTTHGPPTFHAAAKRGGPPGAAKVQKRVREHDESASEDGDGLKTKAAKRDPKVKAPAKRRAESESDDDQEPRPYGTRRSTGRKHTSDGSSQAGSRDDEEGDEDLEDSDDEGPARPRNAATEKADFGLKWTSKDDAMLRKLGPRTNGETWQQIAEYFPARTIRGVKQRWRNLTKPRGPQKSGTSPNDDKPGSSSSSHRAPPSAMSDDGEEEDRNGEPDDEDLGEEDNTDRRNSRGAQGAKWTPEDDVKLMELAAGRKMGDSWLDIAAAFPGRPMNSAKQRWQRLIKREQ